MSPWRDNLGRVQIDGQSRIGASFRGVPFYVASSERSGGRRGPVHEFPARDLPSFDDQGETQNAYPVEGYVVGDEYLQARDALIAALRAPGVGELQHPYHGVLQVVCKTWSVRESVRDGGRATFTIAFVRAEQLVEPAPSVVPVELALAAADAAESAVGAQLVATYSVDGLAPSYIESAERVVEQIGGAISGALAPLLQVAEDLARMRLRVSGLIAESSGYARAPQAAFEAVVGAIEDTADLGLDGVDALLALAGFSAAITDGGQETPSRQLERENVAALEEMFRGVAITAAVRAAIEINYDSHDQAVAIQRRILDAIDALSENAQDDLFGQLSQLRADLTRAIPDETARLPRIVPHTITVATPSTVVAYDLYGDQTREGDLVARNSIENPMFVPGGESLEVLSGD